MMRSRSAVLPFLFTLALGASALADVVVPVSQSRIVSGSASASDENEDDSDTDSANSVDFGPFNAAASASAMVPDAIGAGGGWQDSEILGSSIVAAGGAFANGEGYSFEGFGSGFGQSAFSVTFDLLVDSTYSLTGDIEAFDNGGAGLTLLSGVSTVFSTSVSNGQDTINESGLLLAGQYTLNVSTSGSAFGGGFSFDYASGAYDVTLGLTGLVPSPRATSVGPLGGPFSGGNIVLVTGTCFTPTTTVAFDGIPATSVTYVDASTLQVVAPAHPMPLPVGPPPRVVRLFLAVDVTVADGGFQSTLPLGYVYGSSGDRRRAGGRVQRP